MGELTTPVPRALFPSVLSARDTVAGTYPRDQLVSIPELGTSLGRNSRVMGHPRLTDSPPLPHLCHRSQSCRVSGTASLTPGALGSRLGGQFGSHTKPGALALPSPVLPNPQPAAPSSLHSSCRLPGAARGSQLAPFSHGACLQLVASDRLCELSSGKLVFIL